MGILTKKQPGSTLEGLELRKIAMSALYAKQQNCSLNTFESGLRDFRRKWILENWWGILDEEASLNILEHLIEEAQISVTIPFGESEQKWKSYLSLKNGCDYEDEEPLPDWEETVQVLLQKKVIQSFDEMNQITAIGWDVTRIVFLARLCADAKYINKQTAWGFIDCAYDLVKDKFHTWDEYTNSYILGRTIWNYKEPSIELFREIARKLQKKGKIWFLASVI